MDKSFRILIVDDQPRTRQSLKALITTKLPQIQVDEAENGVAACKATEDLQPNVILMDVLMPEMDGLTCTRLIKSTTPQVNIIVLTMYGDYKASAMAAGADAFISKGDPPEQLLEMLENLVNSSVEDKR